MANGSDRLGSLRQLLVAATFVALLLAATARGVVLVSRRFDQSTERLRRSVDRLGASVGRVERSVGSLSEDVRRLSTRATELERAAARVCR